LGPGLFADHAPVHAVDVRRNFAQKILARTTAPKGVAVFIAGCLARDSYLLTGDNARPQPQHCSVSMSQQQWPSGPPS
jgi:hypothetical protein